MDGLKMTQNITVVVLLVHLLLHVCTTTATTSGSFRNKAIPIGERESLVPVEPTKYQIFLHPYGSDNGRRLAPFQQCGQCKCCAKSEDPSTCKDTPCCYGIVCNIPGKPFGTCALRPKSCDCTNCK